MSSFIAMRGGRVMRRPGRAKSLVRKMSDSWMATWAPGQRWGPSPKDRAIGDTPSATSRAGHTSPGSLPTASGSRLAVLTDTSTRSPAGMVRPPTVKGAVVRRFRLPTTGSRRSNSWRRAIREGSGLSRYR
ncbi:hypothetical protein GCM10010170_085650 [Dactylosporangium salmoneum]|uniref:Uncharacterized protein n=1 Tax=Dactylosporangium salmoneum TaxID=53361 RepID=A0ABN3HFU3_9ACTN